MKMSDQEFKAKFDELRTQEVRMAYVLKGVQKAYHEMPNSKMNPSRHRRDLVKGSKTMTVEDSIRLYFQMHPVPEAHETVSHLVDMVFYLCNQDPEALANYAVAMHNAFDRLLMMIDKHEGREPNCIEFFD